MSSEIETLSPEIRAHVLQFMEAGFLEAEAIDLAKVKAAHQPARETVFLKPGVLVTLSAGPANIGQFRVKSVGKKFVMLELDRTRRETV